MPASCYCCCTDIAVSAVVCHCWPDPIRYREKSCCRKVETSVCSAVTLAYTSTFVDFVLINVWSRTRDNGRIRQKQQKKRTATRIKTWKRNQITIKFLVTTTATQVWQELNEIDKTNSKKLLIGNWCVWMRKTTKQKRTALSTKDDGTCFPLIDQVQSYTCCRKYSVSLEIVF